MQEIPGLCPHSKYLLVKIEPSLKTSFRDGPSTDFDRVILAFAGGRTLRDIGASSVMADIVICPTYSSGSLDEKACSRIGVGSLHATYAEALKHSSMEAD